MVVGLDRAGFGAGAGLPLGRADWLAERGTTRASVTVELAGAWPGFSRVAAGRAGTRLRLTDRFLVADEDRSHGFALPLSAVVALRPVERTDGGLDAIGIDYRAGTDVRRFWVGEHGSRLFRSPRALAALDAACADLGLPRDARPLPDLPTEAVDPAAAPTSSTIWRGSALLWSGPESSSLPTNLRLTTRDLLWDGSGGHLLRLPLGVLRDACPVDRDGHERSAGVMLRVAAGGGLVDLLVRFPAEAASDRHLRERGALLVGLRSRSIPVVSEPAPSRPWQAVAPRPEAHDLGALPPAVDGDAEPTLLAATPAPEVTPATSGEPSRAPMLRRVAAFEAGSLAVLAAIRRGERGAARLLIGESLVAALAEIDDALAAGTLSADDAERRRARLLALNDAAVRFRALAELRAAGLVGEADFAEKRGQVLIPLQERIFAA